MESNVTQKKSIRKTFDWADFLLNNAIAIILLLLLVVIIVIEPKFLSIVNFRNILAQASTRLIFALGVGGITLSQPGPGSSTICKLLHHHGWIMDYNQSLLLLLHLLVMLNQD